MREEGGGRREEKREEKRGLKEVDTCSPTLSSSRLCLLAVVQKITADLVSEERERRKERTRGR